MKSKRIIIWVVIALALTAMLTLRREFPTWFPFQRADGKHTVEGRVRKFGRMVRSRLLPDFERAGLPYPPKSLVLVGLKEEKTLEVYASDGSGENRLIRVYPILAASGHAGPKLREGDLQVPEGIYRIESLNPNSLYHLALRVNYPNDFDRTHAREEGRTNLGGDIMIHGSRGSVGCLAMGDEASEDLFVLAALTGLENIRVVLSPVDFRVRTLASLPSTAPPWTASLHNEIRAELLKYRR